jgi:hypothetical protein
MCRFSAVVLAVLACSASPALAAMSIALTPSEFSPNLPGTVVHWDATVSGASDGTLFYRFTEREQSQAVEPRIIRDFSPSADLIWTSLDEGSFEIEVTVHNRDTGETAAALRTFVVAMDPSVQLPSISGTSHALVFLYTAPPCSAAEREGAGTIRVRIEDEDGNVTLTNSKPCGDDRSKSFYLAGLRAGATYRVTHQIALQWFNLEPGPTLEFTVPPLDLGLAPYQVLRPAPDPSTDVLLQSAIYQMHTATDLAGNLVWYHASEIQVLTRIENGGTFFGISQEPFGQEADQIVREFDLQGLTVRETNAAAINDQLRAAGLRPITGFHHEARRLPDGNILVLASTEQILTDVQGPGPVNIIGDYLVVLDSNLQLVWSWDAFDHLDVTRPALLNQTCTPAGGGCPPFFLSEVANDWTHANSVQRTPDGNLLLSIRHLDQLIKIDYRDGLGTGDVLWTLGRNGDFTPLSDDPSPWFSHQHDAQYLPGSDNMILLFDNGNVRRNEIPTANSRGQVWQIDEAARTARLVLNIDLGGYSPALGSANPLPNGNFHFDNGFINATRSQFVEFTPAGDLVYSLQVETPIYRAFRLVNLYTAPD